MSKNQTLRVLVVTNLAALEKLPLGGQLPACAQQAWACIEVQPPSQPPSEQNLADSAHDPLSPESAPSSWLVLYLQDRSIPRDFGLPVERAEITPAGLSLRDHVLPILSQREANSLTALLPLQNVPAEQQLRAHAPVLLSFERVNDLADAVQQSLTLGNHALQVASVRLASRPESLGRLLLRIEKPSLFLMERWRDDGKVIFVNAGVQNLWVRLGWRHPWSAWFTKPGFLSSASLASDRLLFMDPEQGWQSLPLQTFRDVFELTKLSPDVSAEQRLESTDAWPSFKIPLRWGVSARGALAELWLLNEDQLERLEHLLGVLSDVDLNNLQLAVVRDSSGEPQFVVREIISGRSRHFLDFGEGFSPYAGYNNLLLPTDRTLEPPIRRDLFAGIFKLRGGELVIARPVGKGQPQTQRMQILRLSESLFRPLNSLIDYLVQGAQTVFEGVLQRSVLDIAELAKLPARPTFAEASPLHVKSRRPGQRRGPMSRDDAFDDFPPDGLDDDDPDDPGDAPAPAPKAPKIAPPESVVAMEAPEQAPPDPSKEEALEKAAVDAIDQPQPWVALAQDKFARQDYGQAIACLEHALWLATDAGAVSTLSRTLHAWLGRIPERYRNAALNVRGYVLDFCEVFRQGKLTPGEIAQRLPVAAEMLREHSGHLSKKARWLLWQQLLNLTNDAVEQAHQREQLLGELSMRGVEDRDSFPFVRRHIRQNQRQDQKLPHTQQWLRNLDTHIQRINDRNMQLEITAQRAMSLEVTGDIEGATAAVRAAPKALQNLPQGRGTLAFAGFAAAAARLGLPETESLFQEALKHFAAMPESYEKDLTLNPLLESIQHAALLSAEDTLMQRLFALIAQQTPRRQCLQLHDCAEHLIELGSANAVAERALALIATPEVRGEFYYLEHALRALVACQAGRPPEEALARDMLSLMLSSNSRIDAYGARIIDHALASLDDSAFDLIQRTAAGRDPFTSLMLRSCIVRSQAQHGQLDDGLRRLTGLVEDAWQLNDTSQLVRAVQRLVPNVSHFGRADAGAELIGGVLARLQKRPASPILAPRDQGDILMCCARTTGKLGDHERALALLDQSIGAFERMLAAPPSRDGSAAASGQGALFETLGSIVDEVISLGEMKQGAALVERGVAAVQRWLEQSGAGASGSTASAHDHPFFVHQARIKCAIALLSLEQRERGLALLEQSLKAVTQVRAFDGKDRADLLTNALQAVSLADMDERARAQVLDQILGAGMGQEPASPYSDSFRRDLLRSSIREVVQRHTAYRLAIKKIRATEERIIRSRIAK